MNTGIGDAVNLAWKLASVLSAGAPDGLLDTYELERIGFTLLLKPGVSRCRNVRAGAKWNLGAQHEGTIEARHLAAGARIP